MKKIVFLFSLLCLTPVYAQQTSVYNWLDDVEHEVARARALAFRGDFIDAKNTVLRTYLDRFEGIEGYYGRDSKYGVPAVAEAVGAGEATFHALLQSRDAGALIANAEVLQKNLTAIRAAIRRSGIDTLPERRIEVVGDNTVVGPSAVGTRELRVMLGLLVRADAEYRAGRTQAAMSYVERSYLEGFEPLESRLPNQLVGRIEKAIHLQLRPAISSHENASVVSSLIGTIGHGAVEADRFIARGSSKTFAAVNAFVIVLREGLEAVLLIAALLAYLTASGAQAKHRRQLYLGLAAGVAATIGTWFIAATAIPITGANRELLEGITALAAVVVLLYVANWLFQKTYIHDWKDYLRSHVGGAVSRGSAFAMAALAFAAVYREGFETVLFYQALAFDAGIAPILAGFIPGMLAIIAIGIAIIRANARLPLKKVFGWTNAILMYLAFVFIGKGLYNLQEAGVYSPKPLPMPDHPALRQLFGFYPVAQTVAAQTLFLLLLAGTYIWYRRRMSRADQQRAQHTIPARVA